MGSRSKSVQQTTSVQDIDTTQLGIEEIGAGGVGIVSQGDVSFETTDLGAVQGAFTFGERSLDFAGEFAGEAFDFGGDIARQAGQTAQEAVEVSRQAIATVATGGATDLAGINVRVIAIIGALVAAVFIIPQFIRR